MAIPRLLGGGCTANALQLLFTTDAMPLCFIVPRQPNQVHYPEAKLEGLSFGRLASLFDKPAMHALTSGRADPPKHAVISGSQRLKPPTNCL